MTILPFYDDNFLTINVDSLSTHGRTSILDDFGFYDKRQELMEQRSQMPQGMGGAPGMPGGGMPGMGMPGMGMPSSMGMPGMPGQMQPGMEQMQPGMPMPPPGGVPSLGGLDPMAMAGMAMPPLGGLQGGAPGMGIAGAASGFPGATADAPAEYRSQ